MAEDSENSKYRRLVMIIRQIAKEVAWEIIDEHLEDYEHKEKPAGSIGVE